MALLLNYIFTTKSAAHHTVALNEFINILVVFQIFVKDSTVTGYGQDGRGLIPVGEEFLLYYTVPRLTLRLTQTPIQWILWNFSSGVKRPGREADQYMPRSRMMELLPLFPLMSSRCGV
jgi:hypothetical protein